MVLVYAAEADLAEAPWSISPAPANAGKLLLHASLLVAKETRSALYATDTEGYPSNTVVRAAFRDATCAQVDAWVAAGIDPTAAGAGQSGVVAAKKYGPRDVQYATYERDAKQRGYLTTHLADTAVQILAALGLCKSVAAQG
ncbi:hypothetical protein [Promicromonospora iranensis]|uniref:Uncharacterized protein n=1 Tax=Promicromonospora iranensis TaxID=1105144 RepID=A0ABU2CV77_9MICO|nr:hypothetical protein [Promicromonospora iranensis]MDR7385213.1 hypothetical protein [Promicromonospora iranensis]